MPVAASADKWIHIGCEGILTKASLQEQNSKRNNKEA
jgi:hypothetical protein